MSDARDTGGNPLTEGIGDAARHTAEVAAVLAMGAQAAIRSGAQRLEDSVARDRAVAGTDHAAARLVWSAATRPEFATAPGHDAARVWSAAAPWAGTDPAAAEATRRAEARLSELVPDLMAGYQRLVADGRDPADAMYATSAAALAVSGHERAAAAVTAATPDVAATRPDEHSQGLAASQGHAGWADHEAARAAALAALAYPQPAQAALRVSPPPTARPGGTARTVPAPRRGR
jgi:spermidine/putrescine-binding protein